LAEHCRHARFVWNLAVEQQQHWQPGRRAPGYNEQCAQLTAARADYDWLAAGSHTVQQQALRDFAQAMRNFFNGTHRRPTWRKAGKHEGFRQVGLKERHINRLSRRSYVVGSRDVACELTASCTNGADMAGPGQTLRVPPETPVTVTAVISGAPGTNAVLITAAGRAGRATVGSARTRLQWQLDAAASSKARFARLEVREAPRGRLGGMVALTNPVWLT
jgi:hypothetical protein